MLVSTANSTVNAEYIFGILSEVTHSYTEFGLDPRYMEQTENDDQNVDGIKLKKKKKKKKKDSKKGEKEEESMVYINDDGKIAPSSNIDNIMLKKMSECAGYSYFKDEVNGY